MMKKRALFFTMLLVSYVNFLYSQDRYAHDNLGSTFGASDLPDGVSDVKVDLYTGKLQVGYKLFGYGNNGTGLTNDVVLNYFNGSGNPVDQQASNVGLGWGILFGGAIVREIRGLPDDNVWGFANTSTVPTNTAVVNTPSVLSNFIKDSIDGEFDIYRFNAGASSGEFIIGKNGQVLTIPSTNIKVEKLANPNTTPAGFMDSCQSDFFKITLTNGQQYYYEKYNCVALKYYNNIFRYASTKWYLTKIVAPFSADSIVFDYTTPQVNYSLVDSAAWSYFIVSGPDQGYSFCGVYDNGRWQLQVERDMYLRSILYPNGSSVVFNYEGFGRLDANGVNAINNIAFVSSNFDTLYGYKFRYSYMSSLPNASDVPYGDLAITPSMYNNSWDGQWHSNYYRLQLNEFDKYSGSDTLTGYKFAYNPINLPSRFCLGGVDNWGYYNGKSEDKRLMSDIADSFIYKRRTDFQYTVAKILTNITLPTGGSITCEYEPNRNKDSFSVPLTQQTVAPDTVGGARVKRLVFSDSTGQNNQIVKEYKYVETNGTTSGVLGNFPMYGFVYTEGALGNPGFALASSCPNYGTVVSPSPYLVHHSDHVNGLLYTHGSPVGYGRVEEYFGTSNNFRKKTVYRFSTTNDYSSPIQASVYNDFPFPNVPDLDFCKGLPLEEATYNGSGILERKINHTYACYQYPYNIDAFKTIKAGLKYYDYYDFPSTNSFGWSYSYPVTGKVVETNTVDSQFFANNKYLVNATQIFYDTANNVLDYLLTTNALNEQIKTKFYYPYHFTYTPYTTLKNSNIYSPVRTEKWNNTLSQRLIEGNILEYTTYGNIIKPYKSWKAISNQTITAATWGYSASSIIPNTSAVILKSTMDSYDEKGNLLQTTVKGQVASSVWGYNKHLKIAEVANAAVADIAYTSFENDNDYGGWNVSGTTSYNTYSTGPFTGNRYLWMQSSNTISKLNLDPNKKYILSFWIDQTLTPPTIILYPSVGSPWQVSPIASDVHKGWKLYTVEITTATKVELSTYSSLSLDELRLYPVGALMTTYTYDPVFGVTSTCSPSNRTSYTEYDNYGRSKYLKDMDGNILKSYEYKNQEPQN